MKRSRWLWVFALVALVTASFGMAAPAQAQSGYAASASGCTITITIVDSDARPDEYTIGAVTDFWPYAPETEDPLPSVSATMPASGTYLVEVTEWFGEFPVVVFRQFVPVNCGGDLPAEPLDGADDGDLVVDTTVLIVDTDGVIREGQAFARLLRPTYLGNRSIIDIPFIRAADVFVFFKGQTYKGGFYTPLRVCLRGQGRLLFASVQGRPRQFADAVIAPNTGRSAFQCAWVSEPGTLALVERR
jgi:hypothetical protein